MHIDPGTNTKQLQFVPEHVAARLAAAAMAVTLSIATPTAADAAIRLPPIDRGT